MLFSEALVDRPLTGQARSRRLSRSSPTSNPSTCCVGERSASGERHVANGRSLPASARVEAPGPDATATSVDGCSASAGATHAIAADDTKRVSAATATVPYDDGANMADSAKLSLKRTWSAN